MPKTYHFDIEIDKLTRSLENAISRDSFKTEVLEVTATDIRKLKMTDWLFDWKAEAIQANKSIYKLVIVEIHRSFKDLLACRTAATMSSCL